jgi:hypothetical protein
VHGTGEVIANRVKLAPLVAQLSKSITQINGRGGPLQTINDIKGHALIVEMFKRALAQ